MCNCPGSPGVKAQASTRRDNLSALNSAGGVESAKNDEGYQCWGPGACESSA